MGGQPWLELELHGRLWECSLERGERGKESGRRGEGAAGGARGAVGGGGGCYGGKLRPGCSSVPSMLLAWEENRRKQKRREEGEKKRRREGKQKKTKKKGKKIPNVKISEKIKDNLWSWSKIIFVKERYVPYYK
jgi:hypothetical protein